MTEIAHRFVETNRIHIVEAGSGPLVLLLHGFPELWYSWRHQLRALAEAGFHAVAPDQRGFGQTDRPEEVADYTMLQLVGDVVGLLDALGADQAVVAGHDWGAPVAWNTALMRPDRVRGVIALSIPYRPRGSASPIATMRARFGDRYHLLQGVRPDAWRGRRRAGARRGRDLPPVAVRRLRRRPADRAARAAGRRPARPVARAGRAARLADPAGHRHLRDRVRGLRLHRGAQLLPEHRTQLGTDRPMAPRPGRHPRPVHRR
ncbi:MAG TPA: alpha/beta hydrolase [Actinomycetota bacterium]|jgi:pimeloyl-ACP methyl ester carboxylesterase|nr:alpha/beta hydrolase [Actinomycetota bacterium]